MLMALVLGLGVGGLGGYYGGGDSSGTSASKDATASSAQADAPGAVAAKGNPNPNARPAAPPDAGKPVYIALMKSSPRHGPEHAKVTILDFSDFQ